MTDLRTSVINVNASKFPTVKLGVRISNQTGQGIEGLTKDNFSIYEGGTKQEILTLESEIDNSQRKAPVDLVFVIDTSGSMGYEWNSLPKIIGDLVDNLNQEGIDLQYKVYSLDRIYTNVPNLEILDKGIFKGEIIGGHREHWGPGTAWVAKNYQWRADAARIVIPISDEDCYAGGGWWG